MDAFSIERLRLLDSIKIECLRLLHRILRARNFDTNSPPAPPRCRIGCMSLDRTLEDAAPDACR